MKVIAYLTENRWPNTRTYSLPFVSKSIAKKAIDNLHKHLKGNNPKNTWYEIIARISKDDFLFDSPLCNQIEVPEIYWNLTKE